jgi:hypothetical protein
MKLGKKMVEAKTVVMIAVYMRDCPLARLAGVEAWSACSAQKWGCRWCVISAGGDEILTQPSRSLG